jgi:hypothetical protein
LLSKLAAGAELGEAAYYSLNALSWQAVLVGDPLYRPFKVSLEAQIERLELVPPRLRQYAVIRKMRALQAEGRGREGLVLGEASIRANPGPALALVLADYYLEADRRRDAVRVLRTFERVEHFVSDDWVPVQEIAERLVGLKNPAAAVKIYGNLIESPDMPREIRKECLAAGSRTAKLAGEIRLALEWSTQRP